MAENMLLITRGDRGLATRDGRGGQGGRSNALHATPCPRRPNYSIDEAWDAEDDEQQAADQTVVSEVHKQNRKCVVRQARTAEKSGSEYERLLARGMQHVTENNVRQAEEYYLKAIALEPGRPAAHYNLAILLHTNMDRPAAAVQHFLHAAARLPEESVSWANAMATAFNLLLREECKEVTKPEWWNDEDLKTLSKTVAGLTGAADEPFHRLKGHLMRMDVLSGQCSAWKSGPRSVADLNEAAKHGGLAVQLILVRKSNSHTTGRAAELLGTVAALFHKIADKEEEEAKVNKAKADADAALRAEAESKASAAADALLAEEAAEAAEAGAAATREPSRAKGTGKSKGKGKSSGSR